MTAESPWRYAAALCCVALALLARLALGTAGPPGPPPVLFAAVAAAAWYGGRGPGLLAALFGTALGEWLFLPPGRPSPVDYPREYLPAVEALLAGIFVVWLLTRRPPRADAPDAVQHQRGEQEVRERLVRFQFMIDSLPVLISYVDAQGRYRFNNASYERWFGLQKEACEGRHMRELLGEAAYEALRGHVEAALAGEPRSFEGRIPYQGAGTRDVHVEYVPHRDGDGMVLGFSALIMDVSDRSRAERALSESRERLELALAASDMGVWEWDLRTGATSWSPECYAIFGVETFAGTVEAFRGLVHADDLGSATEAVEAALVGKTDFASEFRVVRPDGGVRWMANLGRACYDGAGRTLRMIGTVQDVTARKDAEAALRASERRWRELAEAMPQLVWTCAADGACDFLSRQWVTYTGRPEAEQLGFGWLEQVHPDDRDGLARAWGDAVATGGRFDVNFRIRRADGVYRWFKTRAVPTLDPCGRVVRWYGSNTDIEDLERATEALRESEGRLRSIVTTAADAIVTIDGRGVIESVNPAAERMFGYAAAEMVGRNVSLLMPPPYRDEHDRYLERYRQTGISSVIGTGREVRALRKDGSAFAAELAVSETEPLRLFTGIIRDVSQRKQLEHEVLEVSAQEQRRIGQELHDSVGQELTGLSLMADALVERLEDASPADVGLAAKVLAGLGRVHQQVRALSRGLVPVEVDPDGLRAALQELAARTTDQSGVACELECVGAVEVADGVTATHLFRIAQEAVSNALRHGRPRNVRIALRADGPGTLTLSIQDDGQGLTGPPNEGKTLGVRLMRYRAGAVGGSLVVGPAVGGGTTVRCTVLRATGG